MTKITYIPGEIANAAIDEHGNRKPVTRAHHIFDDNKNKNQAEINIDINKSLNQLSNEIDAVNKQDVISVDILPDISTADPKKIYRVVGDDNYIDYMVNANGDDWKKLATYNFPGIDDEPIAGSDNLVKSGGVAGKIYELSLKTYNIDKEIIEETTEAVDFYNNDKTELIHHIGNDGAYFKNLKNNGKKVVVEDELTATKESVQSVIDKTNKLEKETIQQGAEEIIIGETEENPTAKFTKDALMVKKLTDLNGHEIGSGLISVIVEGTNVTISFGGLIYELGYNNNTANNSFDFKRILLGDTEIFKNTSDILGPWWIAAVNNADGDNQTPSFTGGGHTYSGGNKKDESATITSTLKSILINGNKVISYSGNAALIDIYWTNLVQAYNTKKVDGSGRAVLQENYHLSFDGSHFIIENNIELLEDVVVSRYYGIQLWGTNKENRTIVYDGARETSKYAGSVDSNSGDTHCFAIHRYDTNYNLEQVAEMYRVGLGEFYLDNSYSAFTIANTGKSYFNIIRKPVNFSQGQRLRYKGSYTFKKL